MAGESLLLWGEWGAAAAVRSSIRAFLLKPSSGDCVPCFLPLGSYTGTAKVWAACSMEVAVISHDSLVVLAGGPAVFSVRTLWWTLAALLVMICVWRCMRADQLPPAVREAGPTRPSRRDVVVQGPVTYRFRNSHPRFHALPERDWGAWPEGRE